MTRHFWNIFTNKKSTEALHDIEVVVRDFGYIVDYKKFAEDYRILQIEVESVKVAGFYDRLSAAFNVEKYNEISLNRVGDDEVFVNVRILA
ncbi:MAG: hypothetical protein IKQ30_00790 [Bacteroidales bacterium]|nr:hypothetical protein [Bacteroidales bacterium]MBR4271356.1 hypothetical protein [Bacteroidales bacterium]